MFYVGSAVLRPARIPDRLIKGSKTYKKGASGLIKGPEPVDSGVGVFRGVFLRAESGIRVDGVRHRRPESLEEPASCRCLVSPDPEWGSGGRGFKSRRPDLEGSVLQRLVALGLLAFPQRGATNGATSYPTAASRILFVQFITANCVSRSGS